MRGPANVSLLGNDGMRSHGHRRRVINFRLVGKGYSVRAHQIPWSPYPGLRIKMTIRTQLGAEASQKKSAPGVKGSRRSATQERAAYRPCLPAHAIGQGERRPEVGVGGLGCSIHLYYTMTSERRSWNDKQLRNKIPLVLDLRLIVTAHRRRPLFTKSKMAPKTKDWRQRLRKFRKQDRGFPGRFT
jgi:hypothetical protein